MRQPHTLKRPSEHSSGNASGCANRTEHQIRRTVTGTAKTRARGVKDHQRRTLIIEYPVRSVFVLVRVPMKLEQFLSIVRTFEPTAEPVKFRSCQAHIVFGSVTDEFGFERYVSLLRSYSTYVAMYDRFTDTVYVFDYYSATTSQHVAKFIRSTEAKSVYYLYKRSDNTGYCSTNHKLYKQSRKTYSQIINNIEF